MSSLELSPEQLRWRCDIEQFDFETTRDLEPLSEILGQDRALAAVRFGIGIRADGYNVYALGPPGLGKRSTVEQFLSRSAATEETPSDWCYIHNFQHPHQPLTLKLSPGRGRQLKHDMEQLVEELRTTIPAALESDEHQGRVQEVEQQAKQLHDKAFEQLAERAMKQGVQIVRTPNGFAMAPVVNEQVLDPEEFKKLPKEDQQRIQEAVAALETKLKELVERVPHWKQAMNHQIKELNQEAARRTIGQSMTAVRKRYHDLPNVLEFLRTVEQDAVENSDSFREPEEPAMPFLVGPSGPDAPSFEHYAVNVLVDNGDLEGAPVVFEDRPTHANLIGRVEHRAQMGTLLTDFSLIKAGALHRANGGYLVVDAERLLTHAFAWDALKRSLQTRGIVVESPAESLGAAATVTLQPERIPLDVKVFLIGDRRLYYMLCQRDRDFPELFKVAVDFHEDMDRTPENLTRYARLVATTIRERGHREFDRGAVACVLERAARLADDSQKLTAHMRSIGDLLREADYWAGQAGSEVVQHEHVDRALSEQVDRIDRVRDRVQEQIHRGSLMIASEGEVVGQVNGLSVLDLGNFAFGRPSRITATCRLGKGEVVDIEREVELGGALHSKGVLILTSILSTRFAQQRPLSLSASLVFEQSYGMVDGDSASVAELCALLSALARVPIRQSLAVTGSVDQYGHVQPIGGVNEKIEGFFDVCTGRGLTGRQGVLIPQTNVHNLMLRTDIVQAVRDGQFHVFTMANVEQAIEVLTGLAAGEPDDEGNYPDGTLYQSVMQRLDEFFQLRLKLSGNSDV